MSVQLISSGVREVMGQLVQGDYEGVVRQCKKSRLSSQELRIVVEDYGGRLIPPPEDSYENLDVVEIKGTSTPTWSVRVPLWTAEEGRSDLTLEFTISSASGEPTIELDDLHVL